MPAPRVTFRCLHTALPLLLLALTACPTPQPGDASTDAPADATADAPPDAPPLGPVQLTLFTPPALRPALAAYAELVPQTRVVATESADPLASLVARHGEGIRVAVLADLTCATECYRVELAAASSGAVVHANNALAAQYGVAHLLERMGYRFFHPLRARVPPAPLALPAGTDPADGFGTTHTAEQSVRGLQLHTLHPIEPLAFWAPSDDNAAVARRIIDWTIQNRGNYVQTVGLNNIRNSPDAAARWRPHTRALLDYAHQRGVRMGVAIQLFGTSNLQRAFDLLDRPDVPDPAARIRERLAIILQDLPWDAVSLNFGEFSGVAPDVFIARVNDVRTALAELAPQAEMSASIHVGDTPATRVTYRGLDQIYYFLVRYADPRIVPWIHTVMYYTLFDDAGGAYHHDDFREHRDYLLERLRAGQRVAYFPESAYWVAFDNSVPTYLPVYLWARHRDMAQVRAAAQMGGFGDLREHVTFSSGWEWGYWQNDAACLRMGFTLPARWEQVLAEMYAPWGAPGAAVVQQLARLGELQRAALIERRLAPYLAGRDAAIDVGEAMNIVSQPMRPSFAAVATLDAAARARFVAEVLAPLEAHAGETEGVLRALEASGADFADRWLGELRDGVAVDALRVRFIAAAYRGAVAFGESGSDGGALAQMSALLEQARVVVARRHADLHWPNARELLGRRSNPTLYPHGYLHYADNLCYWQRELVQLRATVMRTSEEAPGCFL